MRGALATYQRITTGHLGSIARLISLSTGIFPAALGAARVARAESVHHQRKARAARGTLWPLLRVAVVAFGAASAGLAHAAVGADATGTTAAEPSALQEVTVTARRTVENIETVPVAVQALSA
jgi:anti-sigma factor RsiW